MESRTRLFSEPLEVAGAPLASIKIRDVGPQTELGTKDMPPVPVQDHAELSLPLAGEFTERVLFTAHQIRHRISPAFVLMYGALACPGEQ